MLCVCLCVCACAHTHLLMRDVHTEKHGNGKQPDAFLPSEHTYTTSPGIKKWTILTITVSCSFLSPLVTTS